MDLTTGYLGFTLPHPLIVGASPLSATVDGVARLEEAGAAAIVLSSLSEEQVDAGAGHGYASAAGKTIRLGLTQWGDKRGVQALADVRGTARLAADDLEAAERSDYRTGLQGYPMS